LFFINSRMFPCPIFRSRTSHRSTVSTCSHTKTQSLFSYSRRSVHWWHYSRTDTESPIVQLARTRSELSVRTSGSLFTTAIIKSTGRSFFSRNSQIWFKHSLQCSFRNIKSVLPT
jgi:hypothetical protein